MTEHITLHQGYGSSGCLYDDLDEIVEKAVEKLSEIDFDTIVGTGMSGSIVIPLLVKALNDLHGIEANFLLIRKPDASAHTSCHVGRLGVQWLFLDDFISSGSTRDRVTAAVHEIITDANRYRPDDYPRFETTFVGTYLYAPWDGPKFMAADEPGGARGIPGCGCPGCSLDFLGDE